MEEVQKMKKNIKKLEEMSAMLRTVLKEVKKEMENKNDVLRDPGHV